MRNVVIIMGEMVIVTMKFIHSKKLPLIKTRTSSRRSSQTKIRRSISPRRIQRQASRHITVMANIRITYEVTSTVFFLDYIHITLLIVQHSDSVLITDFELLFEICRQINFLIDEVYSCFCCCFQSQLFLS